MIDQKKDQKKAKDTATSNTQEEQSDATDTADRSLVTNAETEPMQTDGQGITTENRQNNKTTKVKIRFVLFFVFFLNLYC